LSRLPGLAAEATRTYDNNLPATPEQLEAIGMIAAE
jgi:hypothetical protein